MPTTCLLSAFVRSNNSSKFREQSIVQRFMKRIMATIFTKGYFNLGCKNINCKISGVNK